MGFYDLNKAERQKLVYAQHSEVLSHLKQKNAEGLLPYFDDEDTYIRKNAYLSVGKIYDTFIQLRDNTLVCLTELISHESYRVRQTVLNAAGEIGKKDFDKVRSFFETGLFDPHHSPRNAVIGSIKKMGQVNPKPVLEWAASYLQHPDKEIRREICHGIELRGRSHPEDILPLLQELEFDTTARVKNTLVHVIGQISYKKGCLEKVVNHLKQWNNKDLVVLALDEIIDVHNRYKNFSALSQKEAVAYIEQVF